MTERCTLLSLPKATTKLDAKRLRFRKRALRVTGGWSVLWVKQLEACGGPGQLARGSYQMQASQHRPHLLSMALTTH